LDFKVNEEMLKVNFKVYGKISSVVIIRNKKGKSKGYGFIEF